MTKLLARFYRAFTFILVGIVAGLVLAIKFVAPPGDEIKIGKIKVKGKGNTAETNISIDNEPKKTRKEKREEKRKKKGKSPRPN